MANEEPQSAAERIQRTLSGKPETARPNGCRHIREKLGHDPGAALYAMRDYGLNDREIARYYGITPSTLRRLERYFELNDR